MSVATTDAIRTYFLVPTICTWGLKKITVTLIIACEAAK